MRSSFPRNPVNYGSFAALLAGFKFPKRPARTARPTTTSAISARPPTRERDAMDTYRHAFDHMAEGFGVLDASWRVLQMNAAGLLCAQRTAEQVMSLNHWDIWPETVGTELEHMYRRVMRTGEPESLRQRVPLAAEQDSVFDISVKKMPDGCLAIFFRDVTDVEATALALQRSQARAEAALNIAQLGSFSWARADNRIECSPRVREIFGFSADEGGAWSDYAGRIMEEDRSWAGLAIDACLAAGRDLRMEFRVLNTDGSIRHVLCHAATEQDAGHQWKQLSGIFQDVTDRTLAAHALRDIDSRKDDFLGLLAHELRNPLAPIVTAAEILRRGDLGHERVRSLGELIQRQAAHVTTLLADLLDVSRIGKGLVTITSTVLDLRKALADAIEQTRPLMDLRGQRFTLLLPPDPLSVRGDETRLVQVFANILNNAAKYTPARGDICLAAEVQAGEVVVRVRDSGMGMSAELLPHVFDAFTQAVRSSDRTLGGLGLGLALVKNLVTLHGGQVRAESPGLGQGSEITVSLPLASPGPARDRRAPGSREPGGQPPVRVVVVDDNVDAGLTLAALLELEGHSVTVIHDAQDALQSAAREPADIYILDIGMPGMDGHELARSLRAGVPPPGPLLIALTGYGSAQVREKSMAAGFDHHFEKPIDPSRLLDMIAKAPRAPSHAQ
jgi:PAS domain S-box-containing protein